jgi:anti-sigma regulatory factor (Ser/Thr protein kinase)
MTAADAAPARFRHLALFYRSPAEYVQAVARFIGDSRPSGDPVLVAVPDRTAQLMDGELSAEAGRVTVMDMGELGRNPARIIPEFLRYANRHRGRHFYCISEPIWPGRSAEEMLEATRHEALTNLAFAESWATALCPYDISGLPEQVLADAARTHPAVISDGLESVSPSYLGPPALPPRCNVALSGPPAHAETLSYSDNLGIVRKFVSSAARGAGMAPARVTDLVIAISELAANTLRHTPGGGTLRIWPSAGEIICQVDDSGQITDPLARHRAPSDEVSGGQGLWLVNQVCDLVQARSGPAGTTTRLHMRLS